MKVFFKDIKKFQTEIIASFLGVVSYFFLRLYNIMSLPIFTDEAIYTRWSQIARYDANWRFISLSDGKQPLFVWFDMILMRFIQDPLLSGRMVSTVAGFFTMIGLFLLGKEIFKNRWIGILSAGLYIIYPFALVYDRMALYDSLVGAFAVWSLYLWILLVKKPRLDVALILGMVIGGGVLTKTSGFFNIYLAPFVLIIFDWSKKRRLERLLKWIGLAVIVIIASYGYYSIQRLSPLFHVIAEKNSIFVYPLRDWLGHPFTYLIGNIKGIFDWFINYMTWPFLILIVLSFFISLKFTKEKILLFLWFIIPFVALALFGRVLYPRFIFFMTLSLLPLIAFLTYEIFNRLNNKYIFYVLLFLFSFAAIRSDYFILTDFANAPIPKADLGQYINDWPAGGGIKEVVSYLDKEVKKGKIYVASLGTFGSLPTYSIEIYFGDNKNVGKRGIFPVPSKIPEDLIERAKTIPVYVLISNQHEFEDASKDWPLKLILEYKKGVGDSYTRLYRVEI
ncbi:MAG: glycosyltransferase family 39 protein [Candidatus Levybacteria bacterium]|nr:glycosyltransferase family 39 protein [Candidatus Levybacteria bacterium]